MLNIPRHLVFSDHFNSCCLWAGTGWLTLRGQKWGGLAVSSRMFSSNLAFRKMCDVGWIFVILFLMIGATLTKWVRFACVWSSDRCSRLSFFGPCIWISLQKVTFRTKWTAVKHSDDTEFRVFSMKYLFVKSRWLFGEHHPNFSWIKTVSAFFDWIKLKMN